MRVELVKVKFDNKVSYKYKPIQYCCEKFKLNSTIVFDCQDESYASYCEKCNENEKIHYCNEENKKCESCDLAKQYYYDDNTIPNFFIYKSEEVRDWDDTWLDEEYYKINYCPHCGEKIEIVVVDEIDVTEWYKRLYSKKKELNEQRRKTDSKKKEYELSKQIRELDDIINKFYGVSEYDRKLFKKGE